MPLLCCTVEEEEEGENDSDQLPTLKVSWKAKKSDESNGGYSEEVLRSSLSQVSYDVLIENILVILSCSQFGPIHHILVSARKKGKAIVSFHHAIDAVS